MYVIVCVCMSNRLLSRVKQLKILDSQSAEALRMSEPHMGPVICKTQYDKIWAHIDGAKQAGVPLLFGGDRALVAHQRKGFFIPPTIFVDVPSDARVWNEEIFGPVMCIRTFETEEEAVRMANDTEYGLAAAVFSADRERVQRVMRQLRVGVVWGNCGQPAFVQAPWGGVKKSGFGRELGRWGLEEFTSVKQFTHCQPGFQWGLW